MIDRPKPDPLLVSFPPGEDPEGKKDPGRELDDDSLIAACAREDSGALGRLFDRHSANIYRFFSRLTGMNSADLDELVSETFLNVYYSAGRFRGGSTVRTWITAIAANLARHHVRSEARRRAFMSVLRNAEPPPRVDADKLAERRDLLQRLSALVGALPYDLRVAYVMCDLEELPGVEVARALGVPEGTLWRRLHEARRCLRVWLEGDASR